MTAAFEELHRQAPQVPKTPTGITGLDEILFGGVPKGRATLICGGPGSGKTLTAVTFLVNGINLYDEPGVLFGFEEGAEAIVSNVASLGYDLPALIAAKKLVVDHIRVERADGDETGEYDLDGLFIRLGAAIKAVGAKRVVLDTLESLFVGFTDPRVLRAELQRLFRWLTKQDVTVVFTGESIDGRLTRDGLEQFVSDCVIMLDHRASGEISTRRLRVVKYRGSAHGTNEYPFLIDVDGITMIPITSSRMQYKSSNDIISSGIDGLDHLLGTGGYYRGSSICLSGVSGTCKSTFAAKLVAAACAQGERSLYLAFEESPGQILRNMCQVGVDLRPYLESGLLTFQVGRPTGFGMEMHLLRLVRELDRLQPTVAVVDPISAFRGPGAETHSLLLRMIDLLKAREITALYTRLETEVGLRSADQDVTSLMDTWIKLFNIDIGSEYNRGIRVNKSRGMNHSNQIREFTVSKAGIVVLDTYRGAAGLLTGSERMIQEAKDEARAVEKHAAYERRQLHIERKRELLEQQIIMMRHTQADEELEYLTRDDDAPPSDRYLEQTGT